MWRTIVISGASSGIGRALAQRLAGPGQALGLIGRDEQRLASTADLCRQLGAVVSTGSIDVRARDELRDWLIAFDAARPIELLVANAGIMGGTLAHEDWELPEISHAVITTNVLGVLNTIHPIMPKMAARGSGQIAILSSIAGFIPLPDAPSYAASKAAVLSYGLALRTLSHAKGVKVNVICPGYVSTPMSEQEQGWKPFKMSVERAVQLMIRGLERDKSIIAFPHYFSLLTRIGGLLPEGVRRVTSRPFRFNVTDRA